jgi:hypothetical protein
LNKRWTPHAGRGGKAKIVTATHAITDLIAQRRKSQANAARDGLLIIFARGAEGAGALYKISYCHVGIALIGLTPSRGV